ncbi:MAG: hypothetical protein HKN58_07755 [Xanthomonadales bacterium]|nr:hypothetical protein [Xanthomonadales bacterium]
MTRDRSESMNPRGGLAGWFDRVRYKEIYRQALGLILVAICAWLAQPGHERVMLGFALALAGQVFRTYAAGTIFKNRRLASSGAYAVVRHPLYLGNLLILGGFVLASGSLLLLAVVALFFIVWYPPAVRYEDAKLERLFGDDWREWRKTTHAIIPTGFDLRAFMDANWSAKQSLIRNGELYISVYLAACAAWLWIVAHG